MAQFPALPLWTDAYLADTSHLTTIEHGAYLLLLMAMWRSGGSLPNDDKKLARIARLTPGQWARIKPVLWEFFRDSSDEITQGRLTDELTAVRQHSRKQSDNARARWLKDKGSGDATAQPDASQTDAPLPLPLPLPITSEAKASSVESAQARASPPSPDPDRDLLGETPKPKRAVHLPEGWTLSQPDHAFAEREGLTAEEIDREADRFRDYWFGKPGAAGRKRDWSATWRNWIRRAVDDRNGGSSRPNGAAAPGGYRREPDSIARGYARAAAKHSGRALD